MAATDTHEPIIGPVEKGTELPRWPWIVVAVVLVAIVAVAAWLGFSDDEGAAASAVPGAVETEINGLIDNWMLAWNDANGDAGLALFTTDGRYVNGHYTDLDGWAGEDLKAGVERYGGLGITSARVGNPMILVRDSGYYVASQFTFHPDQPESDKYLEMYTIVDEDGSLKFRYAEGYSPLGWLRLAEDLPYQMADPGR